MQIKHPFDQQVRHLLYKRDSLQSILAPDPTFEKQTDK